jgi:hypothetical protein
MGHSSQFRLPRSAKASDIANQSLTPFQLPAKSLVQDVLNGFQGLTALREEQLSIATVELQGGTIGDLLELYGEFKSGFCKNLLQKFDDL